MHVYTTRQRVYISPPLGMNKPSKMKASPTLRRHKTPRSNRGIRRVKSCCHSHIYPSPLGPPPNFRHACTNDGPPNPCPASSQSLDTTSTPPPQSQPPPPIPQPRFPSIPIHDPQTPARIQKHADKTRLRAPHQILTTRIGGTVPTGRPRQGRPARHAGVAGTAGGEAAALIGGSLAGAIGGGAGEEEGGFFGAAAVGAGGGALGHGHVVLVQDQLPAVDPGAEAEVGGEEGEEAGDDAGDDGGGVRAAARFQSGGVAGGAGGGGFGCGGAVAAGDGVGDGLSCRERTLFGGLGGGGDGSAAGAGAADDGLHWAWDLVAVAAAETGVALSLRGLLVLLVSSA